MYDIQYIGYGFRAIVRHQGRVTISQQSPLLLFNSNPIWSWKVSIPCYLCCLSADLLSSSSMVWISECDVWRYMCGVHRDLVSWVLQLTATTCQDIKMDGKDLLCVQRMDHNLAQMLKDSQSHWLTSWWCLWFKFWPHNLNIIRNGLQNCSMLP